MRLWILALLLLVCQGKERSSDGEIGTFKVDLVGSYNDLVLNGVPFEIRITLSCFYRYDNRTGEKIRWPPQIPYYVRLDTGESVPGILQNSPQKSSFIIQNLRIETADLKRIYVSLQLDGLNEKSVNVRVIPGWFSLFPPAFAIGAAIVTRQVLLALYLGVYLGAFLIYDYNPLKGFARAIDTFMVGAIEERDNAAILLFVFMTGGVMGVVVRSGGIEDMTRRAIKYADTTRRVSLLIWGLSLLMNFNAHSTMLLIGVGLRPVTNKMRISREKFSFLLDSTASPVACIVPISSWVGYEVGLISEQFHLLGIDYDPYFSYLESIPYRFYPILMVFFVLMVVVTKMDFATMYDFERTARLKEKEQGSSRPEGENGFEGNEEEDLADDDEIVPQEASDMMDPALVPRPGVPKRWWNGFIPLVTMVAMIVFGLVYSGFKSVNEQKDDLREQIEEAESYGDMEEVSRLQAELALFNGPHAIFSNASSVDALLWAAIFSSIIAIVMVIAQRLLSLPEAMQVWVIGCKTMVLANLVLILAWSIGDVCKAIRTGDYLVDLVGDSARPDYIPSLVFIVSGLIAFATGTSWGTMAIVFPLAIPLIWGIAPENKNALLGVIAAILAGSVWGDHCSPISDTTILAASFCGCPFMNHVKTQLPYAITIGVVSVFFGYLMCGFEVYNQWVGISVCIAVTFVVLVLSGKRIPDFKYYDAESKVDSVDAHNRDESQAENRDRQVEEEGVVGGGPELQVEDGELHGPLDESSLLFRLFSPILFLCWKRGDSTHQVSERSENQEQHPP